MTEELERFTVLFVADNTDKTYDVRNILEKDGYLCVGRENFVKALQYLVINTPNLVLIDDHFDNDF